MSRTRLISYLIDGLNKGYDTKYLEKILIENGHNPQEVHKAVMTALSTVGRKNYHNKKPMYNTGLILTIIICTILISFVSLYIFVYAPSQSVGGDITVVSSVSEEEVQEIITKLDVATKQADEKQAKIDEQFTKINDMDTSIEEKQQLIDSQVTELEELYSDIKQERKEVRDLLLELINTILSRR